MVWLAGRQGGNRVLTGEAALKPTIGQVGHMNFIHPFRVQMIGAAEASYLRSLPEDALQQAISRLFTTDLAAIIVANGEEMPTAPARRVQRAPHGAVHLAAAVAARRRRDPPLPVARARRIDDAARRVSRRARDGRADHRRVGDRQERARAGAHLARQRPGRRRHRRALPHLAGHARGPLPGGAARLPRSARHRHAQHPHDLRRDRRAPAQAAQADGPSRGSQQRGSSPSSTGCRSTRPTRRSSACRSAR